MQSCRLSWLVMAYSSEFAGSTACRFAAGSWFQGLGPRVKTVARVQEVRGI